MTDVLTPEERHRNMLAIRSRDTGPEMFIRRMLFTRGYRYRIAPRNIPGHPDLFLRRWNVAIFIHGCFWHRHAGCQYATLPATRQAFWKMKFVDNMCRDRTVAEELRNAGIRQLVIWECTVKHMMKNDFICNDIRTRIEAFLRSDNMKSEL